MKAETPAAPAPDELLELELRIARRADVLAKEQAAGALSDSRWWALAEAEILGEHVGHFPPASVAADSSASVVA